MLLHYVQMNALTIVISFFYFLHRNLFRNSQIITTSSILDKAKRKR